MLRRSDLFKKIESNPSQLSSPGSHIIGDLAYPLKENLLVAYKNTGHLTCRQEKFNNSLSATRSAIERAFALLKGRFRRLKYLNMSNVDKIPRVIIACCVLHNICILNDDFVDITSVDSDDDANQAMYNVADDRREAILKRDEIADNLFLT